MVDMALLGVFRLSYFRKGMPIREQTGRTGLSCNTLRT